MADLSRGHTVVSSTLMSSSLTNCTAADTSWRARSASCARVIASENGKAKVAHESRAASTVSLCSSSTSILFFRRSHSTASTSSRRIWTRRMWRIFAWRHGRRVELDVDAVDDEPYRYGDAQAFNFVQLCVSGGSGEGEGEGGARVSGDRLAILYPVVDKYEFEDNDSGDVKSKELDEADVVRLSRSSTSVA